MKQPPAAEIFSQGDEIVTGQTVDTNAAWLSERLVESGFEIGRHSAVGDRLESLVELLREIPARADCCICSGGLGPTQDDLTAEAVAIAFERTLIRDPEAVIQIQDYFARAGRSMPQINLKQALLPEGAIRIQNEWGTAPGFSLTHQGCYFAFLPGVPSEMRNMFLHSVKAQIERKWAVPAKQLVTLRCAGIGESAIQERLESVAFPDSVRLSFRTGPEENQFKLLFSPDTERLLIHELVAEVARAIGSPVFGIDGLDEDSGDLIQVIGRDLLRNRQCLALFETLSSGKIAARCEGAAWFIESRVFTERTRIAKQLDLPFPADADPKILPEIALALAQRLADQAGSDFALVQIWNFDEKSLFDRKARIALCTALKTPDGMIRDACQLSGTAQRKRSAAATRALDFLRRHL